MCIIIYIFSFDKYQFAQLFLLIMKFSWIPIAQIKQTLLIIPVIATYYLIDTYAFSVRVSQGKSMEPTLREGSVLFIDHFWYKFRGGIQKDDIVVAIQPVNPETHICKRVIQVGGNHYKGVNIPKKHFWLQGDNKLASYDSRNHGSVPEYLIQGKVISFFTL